MKTLWLTKAIHNAGKVLNMKIIKITKIRSKLKNTTSAIGYYSYTKRSALTWH